MAGNDIDYVIHVIYEKFTENQKNKKYENRVYIAEEEFKQDLKEFVKKSSIEDKGLLISEIYRNVSEDVLDISSDGKITISPKVLKNVEKQIQYRKDREAELSNQNIAQENFDGNLDKTVISELTSEQYMRLSKEEKIKVFSESIKGLTKEFGVELDEDEVRTFFEATSENVSTDKTILETHKEEHIREIFGEDGLEDDKEPMAIGAKEVLLEAYKKRNELLSGDFGKIFICDEKLDDQFFARLSMFLADNDNDGHFLALMRHACVQCGYDKEKRDAIVRAAKNFGAKELKNKMGLYIAMESIIREFEPMYAGTKDIPVDEYMKKVEDITELRIAIENNDVEKVFDVKRKLYSSNKAKAKSAIEQVRKSTRYIKASVDERRQVEELAKEGDMVAIRSVAHRKRLMKLSNKKIITAPKLQGREETKLEKNKAAGGDIQLNGSEAIVDSLEIEEGADDELEMAISDFELGSLEDMMEELQFDPIIENEQPIINEETTTAVHAETINVFQYDKDIGQNFVEEEQPRNEEISQNNYLKEITWIDKAKQGLFEFGKKIGDIVKAATSKDKSKGLFARISDAINGSDSSSSDTTSSSSSSSTAGPSVDGKKVQTPVDYLNTQFNIDVRKAAESAKSAAETSKDDKKQITVNESSHEDEII